MNVGSIACGVVLVLAMGCRRNDAVAKEEPRTPTASPTTFADASPPPPQPTAITDAGP